jgi:hypothetical protein
MAKDNDITHLQSQWLSCVYLRAYYEGVDAESCDAESFSVPLHNQNLPL